MKLLYVGLVLIGVLLIGCLPASAVDISLDGPASVQPGEVVEFNLVWTSDQQVIGNSLIVTLDPQFEIIDGPTQCDINANVMTCNIGWCTGYGDLVPFTAKVLDTTPGGVTLHSRADADFDIFDDFGNWIDFQSASASLTTSVMGSPVPEFPIAVFPVVMIIGGIAAIIIVKRIS